MGNEILSGVMSFAKSDAGIALASEVVVPLLIDLYKACREPSDREFFSMCLSRVASGVLQSNPDWTPEQIREQIVAAAKRVAIDLNVALLPDVIREIENTCV